MTRLFKKKKVFVFFVFVGAAIIIYFFKKSYSKNIALRDISMITYGLSGSRFGDGLISYMHAKWLSFKYDIPLLYTPFPQSDYLRLAHMEMNLKKNLMHHLKKLFALIQRQILNGLKIIKKKREFYILYLGILNMKVSVTMRFLSNFLL